MIVVRPESLSLFSLALSRPDDDLSFMSCQILRNADGCTRSTQCSRSYSTDPHRTYSTPVTAPKTTPSRPRSLVLDTMGTTPAVIEFVRAVPAAHQAYNLPHSL